ncbi:hypothetical protein TNCV_1018181 [Trichonephila clavipes]|nr:hypothetical protein TNCV_1018181 [Trichonephila clavipes]
MSSEIVISQQTICKRLPEGHLYSGDHSSDVIGITSQKNLISGLWITSIRQHKGRSMYRHRWVSIWYKHRFPMEIIWRFPGTQS